MNMKTFPALLALMSLLSCPQLLGDTDPGIRDTVRIDGGPLVLGQSKPLTFSIVNDEVVDGYGLGLIFRTLDGGFARYDSVVYVGRMADPSVLSWRIDTLRTGACAGVSPDTLTIFGLWCGKNKLPAGNGAVIQIYLTGTCSGNMVVDSGFFPPAGFFILCLNGSERLSPAYASHLITVIEQPPAPVLIVPDQPLPVALGDDCSFDVSATTSQGVPLLATIVSMHAADDASRLPTIPPTLASGNPLRFSWTPTSTDIGIWTVTLRTCESFDNCVTEDVEIQVVTDPQLLLTFVIQQTLDVCNALGMVRGDFDDDGQNEIFLSAGGGSNNSPAEVYDCIPGAGLQRAYQMPPAGKIYYGPQRAYINDDPYLDVVMEGYARLDWATPVGLGHGDNTFTFQGEWSADDTARNDGGLARGTTLGEFTGDGYLDLASVWYDGVTIYAGDPSGNFQTSTFIPVPDSAAAINSADFDGDGWDDLAVGTSEGVRIYRRTSPAAFTLAATYPQFFGSLDIEVTNQGSDFNGDNAFDLCISTPSVGGTFSDLVVYLGDGTGLFTQHTERTVKGQIFGNCVGDFNGDGKLDIAYVNGAREYVAILFGDGDGNFTNELRYRIPHHNPQFVEGFDIDLDGDLDLVVAAPYSQTNNALFLLTNQLNPAGFSSHSLSIFAHGNAQIDLTSPSGRNLNRNCSSMPSGEYFKRNHGQQTTLDDFATVNVVESGEYLLTVMPRPELPLGQHFDLEFILDGEPRRLVDDGAMTADGFRFGIYPAGSSDVMPIPGKFIRTNPPTFSWQGSGTFDFQLATDVGFEHLLVNTTLNTNLYTPSTALAKSDTTTFYWRYKLRGDQQYGRTYAFSITDNATDVEENQNPAAMPADFALEQNYPNPFNPSTSIGYSLPKAGYVKIAVYNLLGEEVAILAEGMQAAGKHSVVWDGTARDGKSLPSGVYFYRLSAGQFVDTRKMLLLK